MHPLCPHILNLFPCLHLLPEHKTITLKAQTYPYSIHSLLSTHVHTHIHTHAHILLYKMLSVEHIAIQRNFIENKNKQIKNTGSY